MSQQLGLYTPIEYTVANNVFQLFGLIHTLNLELS